MTRPIKVVPGTAIASLVRQADAAFERADVQGIDAAYRQAVALVASAEPRSGELRSALVADHVGRLLAGGGVTLALRRCDEYLVEAAADEVGLLLLRAEAEGAAGDHGSARDVPRIRALLAARSPSLPADDQARLLRVEGLAAADRGDVTSATRLLTAAREHFLTASATHRAAVIDVDLALLAVRNGDAGAVAEAVAGPAPETTVDRLRVATALKRELRYEEAYRLLVQVAGAPDLDPAHRVPVLKQLVVLARLTCQDDDADRLTAMLRDAMTESGYSSADAELARLSPGAPPGPVTSTRFGQAVQDARRLLDADRPDAGQLDEVESVLTSLRPAADTVRDETTWHLAAGELHLARHRQTAAGPALHAAIVHLGRAVDLATDHRLVEIQLPALRRLGRAYARRRDGSQPAAWCWGEAHRLEEKVASRQVTDGVRIGMLLAASDEHDERIAAATEATAARGGRAAAGIVVAMEAARGATILGAILPGEASVIRELPELGDIDGAWRWTRGIARSLPRSQVAWLLHATPDHVHHAIIGRGFLYHLRVPVRRAKLEKAVNDLTSCWDPDFLEAAAGNGEFDQALANLAGLIAVGEVVRQIPTQVRRVATIAGGALAEIPFAALPVSGAPSTPLARQYAFSDLPCLSARWPLHLRSQRQRGDHTLLVSPPGDGLTSAAADAGRTLLAGADATLRQLRAEAESHRHQRVRIDAHGWHDPGDPASSWLQLAPEGRAGRLHPESLQGMNLHGCGTLVLGACESGMAHRRGRDERVGFVRAAVHAGAGAVVAARWVADDGVAAAVLDRFERYLRYLPRDLALQQAQLDLCDGAADLPSHHPGYGHPARWACWALYGDSGWQAGAGPLRRRLRRRLSQRRHHA
jgi:CHAT domain